MNAGDHLPPSWSPVPLRVLGKWRGGGTPAKNNRAFWSDGSIPWVSPKDMKQFTIRDAEDHITLEAVESSATTIVPTGSVLIVTRSGILRHTLPIAVNEVPVAINQDLKGLELHEGIDARYVAWVLRRFRDDILHLCSKGGTTVQSIVFPSLLEFRIPVAPTAEQRRIVAAIEEQYSRIDAGVEALQRARRNLQRMRAAVLQAAVTGRLVPQDPHDESAARRVADAAPIPGLYPLPSGWLWARVEVLAEVQGGIQKQPKRRPRDNAYPFLRVANVLRNELDLSEVHTIELFNGELGRYRLRRGDLLVVEGNGSPDQIGRSALWRGNIDPCVHQNHLIRVRPGPALNPDYLNLFWNAPSTATAIQAVASSTSGLYTLSTAKVRAVPVAVPPLPEQQRIILEVNRQVSLIDGAQRVIDDTFVGARSLRATILERAFSGRLVPQDPFDESAKVLLDRIKAARTDPATTAGPGRRSRR